VRSQLKYYHEYERDEAEENEKQKQAVLAFQRRYAEQRPGLRITGWGIAIFFGEVVLVAAGAWLLITLILSLV